MQGHYPERYRHGSKNQRKRPMKHDKEYLREWMEFAEQIRQDSSKTADDSDNHGESSQPFKEQHANISTFKQSGFTSFGNADAVPVEATHSFGLQKLLNGYHVVGCVFTQPVIRYMIGILKTLKRNIIHFTSVVSVSVNKFFKIHNR